MTKALLLLLVTPLVAVTLGKLVNNEEWNMIGVLKLDRKNALVRIFCLANLKK